MSITALALFATLVIDGQVYDNVATAHTLYRPGPSGKAELHVQSKAGMSCSNLTSPESASIVIVLDRVAFGARIVRRWDALNVWIIETGSEPGHIRCQVKR